ncbi:MAG TPA: hypothetical protein VNC13_01770, partial [Propionibacteriaceae bacterium]|nr:hypothetical protein [Propionibacteriaceae bacterium]
GRRAAAAWSLSHSWAVDDWKERRVQLGDLFADFADASLARAHVSQLAARFSTAEAQPRF